jgi:hypothetical protein
MALSGDGGGNCGRDQDQKGGYGREEQESGYDREEQSDGYCRQV